MGLQPLEPVQGSLEGEGLSWEGAEPGLWSEAGARQPGFKSSYLTSGNCLTHVLVFWPVNWGQEYNQPHRAVLQDQEVNTENQVSTGKSLYLGWPRGRDSRTEEEAVSGRNLRPLGPLQS